MSEENQSNQVTINKQVSWKVAAAKFLWRICPPLRYRELAGIGYIANPREISLIITIPNSDPTKPAWEPLSIDVLEEPIIDAIEDKKLGVYDGHGFCLETGNSEIFLNLYRNRLVGGIKVVQQELRKHDLAAGVTLDIMDYQTTTFGLHDDVTA